MTDLRRIVRRRGPLGSLSVPLEKIVSTFLAATFLLTAYIGYRGFIANNRWKIGDWLINYRGGFVRRGLAGEFFIGLSDLTGIAPGVFVLAIQVASYLAFFYFSGLLILRQKNLRPFSLLIFSPFIFLFHIHDPQGGFRKEIIFLALLAYLAWTAVSAGRDRFKRTMSMSLIVYPAAILTHEMLAVYLPYLLAIYAYMMGNDRGSIRRIFILLIPSVAAFLVSLVFHGSAEHVAAICNSLGAYAPPGCEHDGAIAFLRNSTEYGLQSVVDAITATHFLAIYILSLLLVAIAYVPVLGSLRTLLSNRLVLVLIALSIAGTVPLLLVAIDWGRYLYVHFVALFVLALVVEADRAAAPRVEEVASQRMPTWLDGGMAAGGLGLALMAAYATLWRLPYCCPESLLSDHVRTLAGFILKWSQ